ncbi:MAG TPA: cell division protein FtsQ/DivIB [Burkholderiales bacterium]
MWDNPRLLNIVAGALVGVAMLFFAAAGFVYLVRSPLSPVREVVVTTELKKTTRQQVESAVRATPGGNFFAYSLPALRANLESLPWVRRAELRRVWPDRIDAQIEEHVALARWGDDALVNTQGERFVAKTSETLPVFIAPRGNEAEVARRYARFAQLVAPLGAGLERVVLTPRLAWQLRLSNGLHLMLGRDGDQAEARLARFVDAYPATLGRMARRHDVVDLRYPNGFALRLPENKS